MRRLLPSLLVLFTAVSGAQPTPRSLLWAITPPMGEPSFLYGTFHSRDARVFRFQDSVLLALEACDLIAGELEVNEARRLDPSITNAMLLPSGGSLDRLYNKRDYRQVIGALKARLGPLAPMCTKLRPFYIVAMLSEMELGNDSSTVLDAWFQERAIALGKKVVGLELLSEQLAAVEKIPLRDQARLLFDLVTHENIGRELNAALKAYLERDLDALFALAGRDGLPEHADKALLEERNLRMAERFAHETKGKRRLFAAVGAAHLPGAFGMLAVLRSKGFDVRPVGLSPAPGAPSMIATTPVTGSSSLPPAMMLKKGVHLRNDTLGFAVDMPVAPCRRIEHVGDTLRVTTWTGTSSDGHLTVSVTTSEGSAIERTDARSRIEAFLMNDREDGQAGPSLTRIDGAQAIVDLEDDARGDRSRRIIVATPKRMHTFLVSQSGGSSSQQVDEVVQSIRINEEGKDH